MPRRRRRRPRRSWEQRVARNLVTYLVGGFVIVVLIVWIEPLLTGLFTFLSENWFSISLIAVGVTTIYVYVRRRYHLRKRLQLRTLDEFMALTSTQFELAVADLLRDLDYRDVQRTGGSGDLQADITCRNKKGQFIVVQCKHYNRGNRIGSPDIQTFIGMIYGHHRADFGIFVTTSDFSQAAIDLAEQQEIRLINSEELVRLVECADRRNERTPMHDHWPFFLGVALLVAGLGSLYGSVFLGPALKAMVNPKASPTPMALAPATIASTPEPAFTPLAMVTREPVLLPTAAVAPTLSSSSIKNQADAIERIKREGYSAFIPPPFSDEGPLRVFLGLKIGTADGYNQRAFFFLNDDYLGTDTLNPSAGIRLLVRTPDTVTLSYVLYRPNDGMCCPTGGSATVRYHWNGTRLVPLDPIPSDDWNAPLSRR